MTRVNAILPFAFMGGLSFIAALLCWFLPETIGKQTPEVIEDTDVKQGRHIHKLEIYGLPGITIQATPGELNEQQSPVILD